MFALHAKNKRSSIWNYFNHVDRDKIFSTVICKFCGYNVHYNGNSIPLRNHLAFHKDEIIEFKSESQYIKSYFIKSYDCRGKGQHTVKVIRVLSRGVTIALQRTATENIELMNNKFQQFMKSFHEKNTSSYIQAVHNGAHIEVSIK